MTETESKRILSIDRVANGYLVNLMLLDKDPIEVASGMGGIADILGMTQKRHPVEHHVCLTWADVIRVVTLADPQAHTTIKDLLEDT